MAIKIDWDRSRRQGIISGEYFQEIREHFSVQNDAAKFARHRGRFIPSRKYAITPGGRFEAGLINEIDKYIIENQLDTDVIKADEFCKVAYPGSKAADIPELNLPLRDYQSAIVDRCISNGRGVIVLATAGGKTLTIATLLESYYRNNKTFKCALVVPDRGLVTQIVNDFAEYGVNFTVSKWTGDDDLNLGTNVVVCNMGILQSKKSDTDWLSYVDVCVVDEVHKLRKGNKINKLFKQVNTPARFGFTGTMPDDLIDQWNIKGLIGPIIYEKTSYELRSEKYIADAKVQILKLEYDTKPNYPTRLRDPSQRYRCELDYIMHSSFRNNILSALCNKFDKNSLIMVDYIEHGQTLHNHLKKVCPDKKCYFIRGDVDIESRDKVKQLMEEQDDIVVVAISKIFSTGINIKNLHYIIFGSGGKAKIKILQSIGRGLRLHTSKTKLIIFDIGDDLQYGRQHLVKRISYYERENIEYGIQTITEKTN